MRQLPKLAEHLSGSGAGSVRYMTGEELYEVVRTAYDPTAAAHIDHAQASGQPTGLHWEDAGPIAAERQWDYYAHDGAVSRTWQMVRPPRGTFGANVLADLLAPHTDITRKRVALRKGAQRLRQGAQRVLRIPLAEITGVTARRRIDVVGLFPSAADGRLRLPSQDSTGLDLDLHREVLVRAGLPRRLRRQRPDGVPARHVSLDVDDPAAAAAVLAAERQRVAGHPKWGAHGRARSLARRGRGWSRSPLSDTAFTAAGVSIPGADSPTLRAAASPTRGGSEGRYDDLSSRRVTRLKIFDRTSMAMS